MTKPYQEPLEVINLGTFEDVKELQIGTLTSKQGRSSLIALLHEYNDIFAWSYLDMSGLDIEIVTHQLPLKPKSKSIRQKLRKIKPEMLIKIKEKVKKQFSASFFAVAKYPEWVANIVTVPKKDRKVRMFMDYRDLNRTSPKDNFPLPYIDVLVDNTVGYSTFSFMDGFSRYNQIKMAPEDREKTTFITLWGTFYYKVMPFGLKNVGETYQKVMVTLFHYLMHKEIEFYVDDMIAKSRPGEGRVDIPRKIFDRLRNLQLKLNPAKCIFGVSSGKLLGFIVSEEGIKLDLDKVKAIVDLKPPKTQKNVRSFLGRLNYIARFISHITQTCESILRLLRKSEICCWNENFQKAFDKIKNYLQNPSILVPPTLRRPLILYLKMREESIGYVLGQHDSLGRKERVVYYLIKKFTSYESKYSLLEKRVVL
ncbi:uncharacterized protein E5676_scaffold1163G00360 [Cucumis melo var. makuwa]|uniref:Reverse transcriptase domain-containing protein n=1 Tax=Cucumis melo var. makuwa TaxID=1194695 RepID=A0A5D3DGJ2_CUCMM|nr:uncharacterized protein E6C27_scaffold43052G00580 [Cucumis melo var. makuwa]TYK22716.1 uncharacterized protein E5676_scaffold1163G00360 [Cucumis melo var. makuwa]